MSLPTCAVCKDAQVVSVNRKTCGHPRCVKTYRNTAPKTIRSMPKWKQPDIYGADLQGRRRIVEAWDRSRKEFGDAVTTDRVLSVAQKTGSRPAEVLGVIESVSGRAR